MTVTDLQATVARATNDLDGADAVEILRWAAQTFGDRFCVASSMADTVLVHLAARAAPGVDVVFLDTGYHFAETIGTRDAVAALCDIHLVNVQPELSVAEQDAAYGKDLFAREPDRCCAMRKVAPLERALAGYDAWASGMRRDEAVTRRGIEVVEWDARRSKVKVNPLAAWTQEDVDRYVAEHGVLVNPLLELGYPSIGCAPCTRRIEPGEDPRAGRWSGRAKTECGLHT
jgi:phosphoadenosine phosphosulfate reductase